MNVDCFVNILSDGDSTPSLSVQAAILWYDIRDTYGVRFVADGCRKNLPLGDLPLNARVAELAHFADSIEWLSATESAIAYEFAMRYNSTEHYGLASTRVSDVERIDASTNAVDDWLLSRCIGDSARIVFGPDSVFDASTQFFRDNWRDLFCPSRDDAIICSNDNAWLLFYCHEDEFEFGRPL